MRTTIDLPDELMKKAKIRAIEEGISLKAFFTRCLENELLIPAGNSPVPTPYSGNEIPVSDGGRRETFSALKTALGEVKKELPELIEEPWKDLESSGDASKLSSSDSGFDGYNGPIFK